MVLDCTVQNYINLSRLQRAQEVGRRAATCSRRGDQDRAGKHWRSIFLADTLGRIGDPRANHDRSGTRAATGAAGSAGRDLARSDLLNDERHAVGRQRVATLLKRMRIETVTIAAPAAVLDFRPS